MSIHTQVGRVTEFVLLAGNRLTTVGKRRLPTETFVAELLMIRSEDEIVSSLIRIDTTFIGSKQWNNIFVGKLYPTLSSSFIVRAVVGTGFLIPQACEKLFHLSLIKRKCLPFGLSIGLLYSLFVHFIFNLLLHFVPFVGGEQQHSANANPVVRQASASSHIILNECLLEAGWLVQLTPFSSRGRPIKMFPHGRVDNYLTLVVPLRALWTLINAFMACFTAVKKHL
ncbi:hypothetical protein T07_2113 [Trichinella nelsoni]|uniref:Uncharacterized protein n=1 Tax=Trichinella nelsoni TaxID=6336 RepID=A0A0V0SD29_9BILA|nr:hypothetical protein T07_2113 [Trichinella nelsoni]